MALSSLAGQYEKPLAGKKAIRIKDDSILP
jgi:hypothetical protein